MIWGPSSRTNIKLSHFDDQLGIFIYDGMGEYNLRQVAVTWVMIGWWW